MKTLLNKALLRSRTTLAITATFLTCNFCNAQDFPPALQELVAPGAKLELVTDTCKFTEGPAADINGNVYFTDQPNNRILKIDLEGNVSVFLEDAGRSNGMFFDSDWSLITCADEKNELWLIRSTGSHDVLFKAEDKPLNGPNDLWIAQDNLIYFTDPYYQRPWWEHKKPPRDVRGLYSVEADGSELTLLDGDFKQPNGIIGSNKDQVLYVADIDDRKIYVYPIEEGGALGKRKLFCEEPSDGMTLDNQGNLYITNSNGVTVYNKAGKKLGSIATGEGWTANACFGGKNHQTLFVTASDSVYSLQMKVSGVGH